MAVRYSGLLVILFVMVVTCWSYWRWGSQLGIMDSTPKDATGVHPKIDAASLVERLTMPVPLTIEQIKEEQRMEMEQVNTALNWLNSTDSEQRIVGAEQLGAYPTAEAEKALAVALSKDADPEVRVAAATSLANFQEPGTAAIRGLLSVLRDQSEDVRHAALGTLAIYLETLDSDSARHRQITAALGKLAKSPNMDPATRKTLSDLISKH